MKQLETDYLVVGSGAVGMAFVDTLLAESSYRVVIVDQHGAPGGHWNDAYSFVRLHQPSAYYGVNSKPLGKNSKDEFGINQGMYERASAAELLSYYEQVMTGFIATGRVQYFSMSNYLGDHQFESVVAGTKYQVNVARKFVDTTYLKTSVPSTHTLKYEVSAGVRVVPLNELPKIKAAPSGYVVVGSGKTGMDACIWLLESGVNPDNIHWVMPRDAWYLNRVNVQPGEEFFEHSYGAFASQAEAVAQADSVQDVFKRLEAAGQLLRFDENVEPTMYHGAVTSDVELATLRRIKNVVRMGRIQRIEPTLITFAGGVLKADPNWLYVDCSASAIILRPSTAVFSGSTITPQFIRTVQPTFSAALTAYVEAHFEDEVEKNEICNPVPLPDKPIDWLKMMFVNMANQQRWGKEKAMKSWIAQSRLDGFTALALSVKPDDLAKQAILQRFGKNAGPAVTKLYQLLSAEKAL
jgi:NAD(P)-binding Rossmann-like domain